MAIHTSLLHRLDALSPVSWKIYSFRLPYLSQGFREGLLVHVKNSAGEEKWAEVAPLKGRSSESIEQACDQLLDYFSASAPKELFPSVQFGLENLHAPAFETASARLYAFLCGTPEEVARQAEIALTQGYDTVKIKISPFSISDAKQVLHSLQKNFRLRVDCNKAFSFEEAVSLFSPFDPSLFDYIEEPTREIARLPEFTHPFALDETATQFRTLPLEEYPKLYGFILKPTILGGKKGCSALIDCAQKRHLKVVFSPAYESGVGLLQILSLAKHFNLLFDLIGLDTHRYLRHDLLMPPVNFSTSKLTVTAPLQINPQLLKEIAHGTGPLPHL
jgi:O-succinylbenzoate synthase